MVFATIRDNLFPENHSLILIKLLLAVFSNVFMLMCSKNKLVPSLNIIGTSTNKWDHLNKTKIVAVLVPSIEPCGTLQLISYFIVPGQLVIFSKIGCPETAHFRTKLSCATTLCKMTWQFELLTGKFLQKYFFRVTNPKLKNERFHFELQTWSWKIKNYTSSN